MCGTVWVIIAVMVVRPGGQSCSGVDIWIILLLKIQHVLGKMLSFSMSCSTHSEVSIIVSLSLKV